MSQVDAKLEMFRHEIATQLGLNVDPLHKDLHDLLDQQMQAAARLEKLEAANFVMPEDLQEQFDGLADVVAKKVQPVISVMDQSTEDRLAKIESKLRFF